MICPPPKTVNETIRVVKTKENTAITPKFRRLSSPSLVHSPPSRRRQKRQCIINITLKLFFSETSTVNTPSPRILANGTGATTLVYDGKGKRRRSDNCFAFRIPGLAHASTRASFVLGVGERSLFVVVILRDSIVRQGSLVETSKDNEVLKVIKRCELWHSPVLERAKSIDSSRACQVGVWRRLIPWAQSSREGFQLAGPLVSSQLSVVKTG